MAVVLCSGWAAHGTLRCRHIPAASRHRYGPRRSAMCARTFAPSAAAPRGKKETYVRTKAFSSFPLQTPAPCLADALEHATPALIRPQPFFFARTLERDPGRGQKSTTAWRASRRRRLARHLGLHQAGRARALPTLTRRRLRPPAHHLALRSQPLRLGATSLSVLRVERKSAPCFTYVPCVQCQLWKLHRSMFHLRTYPT